VMTLDSADGGAIEYPSLSCGGSLSGGGSGGVYHYSETITYGLVDSENKGCITGGSIRVVLQGEGVFWEWKGRHESQDIYASGKLYRVGPKPVTGSCAECGQALMNDIAYGLPESQNFRRGYANPSFSPNQASQPVCS